MDEENFFRPWEEPQFSKKKTKTTLLRFFDRSLDFIIKKSINGFERIRLRCVVVECKGDRALIMSAPHAHRIAFSNLCIK